MKVSGISGRIRITKSFVKTLRQAAKTLTSVPTAVKGWAFGKTKIFTRRTLFLSSTYTLRIFKNLILLVTLPAMHYASIENLSKSFGIRTLFNISSFHVEE